MFKIPPEHTKQRKAFAAKDLELEAVFESKYPQPCIMLLQHLEEMGQDSRWHRVPDTGFRVQFKSYVFRTRSKALVKTLMACQQKVRGKIFPSLTDPSGFWRKTIGAELKIETREVLEIKNVGSVTVDDLDFGALKGSDPNDPVRPLVTTNTVIEEPEELPVA